jgi:hypothetical protein
MEAKAAAESGTPVRFSFSKYDVYMSSLPSGHPHSAITIKKFSALCASNGLDWTFGAGRNFHVTIPKSPGLGILIKGTEHDLDASCRVFVLDILKAQSADLEGTLRAGDTIMAIGGVATRGKSLNEVLQMLRNAHSPVELDVHRLLVYHQPPPPLPPSSSS